MVRQDILDSRSVIERIEELESSIGLAEDDNEAPDEDEVEELAALKEFAEEAEGYTPDWHHGEGMIADSYFQDYARELADDIGTVGEGWPCYCIDWEAAANDLQMDYTAVELDGYTFWTR